MKKREGLGWNKQPADIPDSWRAWLLHSGSFMQRLAQQGVSDASIQVLQQHWQLPESAERKRLNRGRERALIREVLILSKQSPWMFARTVIPRDTLTSNEELACLENRSLGSLLFQHPALQRSEFEITSLQPGRRWHRKVARAVGCVMPPLWARRSLFFLCDKPLLLTEVFLPAIGHL